MVPSYVQKCDGFWGNKRQKSNSTCCWERKKYQGFHTGLDVSPIPSMYGVFTYIWLNFMANVGNNGKKKTYMDAMAMGICYFMLFMVIECY